jgi:hypothetical protein
MVLMLIWGKLNKIKFENEFNIVKVYIIPYTI